MNTLERLRAAVEGALPKQTCLTENADGTCSVGEDGWWELCGMKVPDLLRTVLVLLDVAEAGRNMVESPEFNEALRILRTALARLDELKGGA